MFNEYYESVGIFIPFNDSSKSSYNIYNNIIEYKLSTPQSNNGIAINASILQGMINYNDIYNFSEVHRLINNGNANLIGLGDKNIYVDPKLIQTEKPSSVLMYAVENYYCCTNSECIGAGYYNHNIGVGVDNVLKYIKDNYVNIIDTVTSNIGYISDNIYGDRYPTYTFFNSVFTESANLFNSVYRNSYGPYPSKLVYENQFGFVLDKSFPFERNDMLYDKNFYIVLANKDKLSPFDNITCPPNPGYGYPTYDKYETGLWGFPRLSYRNNCSSEGCIIQDVLDADIIEWVKSNEDADVWVYDKVSPDCLSGSPDIILYAPVITILGSNPTYIEQYSLYNDSGATALDAEDGDITHLINSVGGVNTNILGTYTITYNVFDSNNMSDTKSRAVYVTKPIDNTPPVITIIGDNPLNHIYGSTYTDLGATAYDNVDGDITSAIVVTNTVNANNVGTYEVIYKVSDSRGNSATAVRTVLVEHIPMVKLLFSDGSDGYVYNVANTSTTLYESDIAWALSKYNKSINNVVGVILYNTIGRIGYASLRHLKNVDMDVNLVIPNSVDGIDLDGFSDWSKMRCGVDFSKATSLTYIEHTAFNNWINADMEEDLVIPSTVIEIQWGAFARWSKMSCGVDFSKATSLTHIGVHVFDDWYNADMEEDLVIPSAVIEIDSSAFADWSKMSCGVDFSKATSLTSIGWYAFNNWYNADMEEDLVIPSTVIEIGLEAFADWSKMRHGVTFQSIIPPRIQDSAFSSWTSSNNGNGIKVTVPPTANLSSWKAELTGSGEFYSINDILWNDIP
jgi:hypothetical protein